MIRVVGIALLLALLVVLIALAVSAVRGRTLPWSSRPPALPPARWVAAHRSQAGTTRVVVELRRGGEVLESRRVEDVPDDDPDYDARFLEAMARAESRADVLNRSAEP